MIKGLAKRLLRALPVALTKNERYDRLTARVIRGVVRSGDACVDIGCHAGDILDLMIKASPSGKHWGFEPVPDLFTALQKKYAGSPCTVLPLALRSEAGLATFNYVLSNPAYSGLKRRAYDRPGERDTTITVQTARLDDVLPGDARPALIKIDVEGGELGVLLGAVETLRRSRPIVIFEHGLGASDVYGTTPESVHAFLSEHGYRVYTLEGWLRSSDALPLAEFQRQFYGRINHYFLAAPVAVPSATA